MYIIIGYKLRRGNDTYDLKTLERFGIIAVIRENHQNN